MDYLIVLATVGGVLLIAYAHHLKKSAENSSTANIVYMDLSKFVVRKSGVGGLPSDVLFSRKLMLKGKPDRIVLEKGHYVPVELKSSKRPASPYPGHVMQLAAYCALIEEVTGRRVPHGYIQYADGEPFKILFDERLKTELINTLDEMRLALRTGNVRPTRNKRKCENCSMAYRCPTSRKRINT
ncbi:CRISPR-associated protein Cas4 [Archaeoglobus neptunius]|uniref:CRISPR-associated protein Cas4 n=1 Tax=Archaeoglobus neptunius TaxID=2798580 RepID=UPI00192844AD|nr:CRISPR-associated protein Cas4 [Archaeoglobus neptunius]